MTVPVRQVWACMWAVRSVYVGISIVERHGKSMIRKNQSAGSPRMQRWSATHEDSALRKRAHHSLLPACAMLPARWRRLLLSSRGGRPSSGLVDTVRTLRRDVVLSKAREFVDELPRAPARRLNVGSSCAFCPG